MLSNTHSLTWWMGSAWGQGPGGRPRCSGMALMLRWAWDEGRGLLWAGLLWAMGCG